MYFELDIYKDVLKNIKDQSMQQAKSLLQSTISTPKKSLKTLPNMRNELTLPSIQNTTLQDISKHFTKTSKKSSSPHQFQLDINKSSQIFIQQSLNELEQSQMSKTYREIIKEKSSHKQRLVPPREPTTIKALEKKFGFISEQQKKHSISARVLYTPEREIQQQTFFEETLNTLSYVLPSRRESCQIAHIRDKLYVFGGMTGAGLTSDLWIYDLKTSKWMNHQSDIDIKVTDHIMLSWKNQLILFGGSGYYDARMKIRQVYSTLAFFNTLNGQWTKSIESIEARRQHKAVILQDKFLIITGGIDAAEALLNDTIMYSLESKRWLPQRLQFSEGVAQHAVCVGYDYRRGMDTVYLYGGKTKSLESFPLMKLVLLGNNPQSWEVVVGTGQIPEPRYNHTMECINDQLILIGGKSEATEYQEQIFLFSLQYLCWQQIKREGVLTKRWSHSSCVFNSQILCFGGINDSTYLPAHVYSIETDSNRIRGKVIMKKKTTKQNWDETDDQPAVLVKQDSIKKTTCRLAQYRSSKKYNNAPTYIPFPQMRPPRIRYDILCHWIKGVMIDLNYI
ncbi:hypothetical protein pb186bvf_003571 [Paramecium bursaria]